MEQVLTLVCKLNPTPTQSQKLEIVLHAFAEACNYTNQIIKPDVTSKLTIQGIVYEDLRAKFGLPANLAVRACARVGANRKTAKQNNQPVVVFKPTSADYDARIFAFREKDWTVSLTTLSGREHIKIDAGNYQRGKLKGRKPTSAQLCKHRDGQYYIHIQLKDEVPDPQATNKVIGVDFGRRDIAATSKGDSWSGEKLTQTRDKYNKTRASLQKKASTRTRSSRRRCRQVLVRLSGRERRFQAWVNHNISKTIIQQAKSEKALVAIEDLTGIRERTNQKPRNKTERRRSNSWAFYQLRMFLEYKGLKDGVEVITVPPAYTSQTCNRCLHIGLRSEKKFKCGNCGLSCDADLNGAKMIALLGLSVSQPRGSNGLYCNLSTDSSGLLKALTVFGTPNQCG
ncbi:IS200/IS605 family element transposase accessory protein TnpB [Calothrix sp. FACHB-1219]|uniref:RNA-guided endonuclease InsQ/TnpB family protein n=1 Tax=unclassified Calothrix TaxID=2619626 RepID=UPI0016885AB4|nr:MULTISPECIES: RNA-guided endonuclease TnpB family protein [unclassified Calothrix]MBD2204042.1 IS200/IS605 family element transposase accessory protein TnpB [Calothrix sp. FACHB-168]MBD2221215.1 IS200/IS605 family element transposase accessory protein TnpB [Calothrix sp. FACHB-1219]